MIKNIQRKQIIFSHVLFFRLRLFFCIMNANVRVFFGNGGILDYKKS